MDNYIDYERIYGLGEYLGFPRVRRAYFDYISSESQELSAGQKLLDIAYLLTHGYDVRHEIHATYLEHMTPTRRDVIVSVCMLYGELTGENCFDIMFRMEDKNGDINLDSLIDAFFKDLRACYHLPADGTSHYIEKRRKAKVDNLLQF